MNERTWHKHSVFFPSRVLWLDKNRNCCNTAIQAIHFECIHGNVIRFVNSDNDTANRWNIPFSSTSSYGCLSACVVAFFSSCLIKVESNNKIHNMCRERERERVSLGIHFLFDGGFSSFSYEEIPKWFRFCLIRGFFPSQWNRCVQLLRENESWALHSKLAAATNTSKRKMNFKNSFIHDKWLRFLSLNWKPRLIPIESLCHNNTDRFLSKQKHIDSLIHSCHRTNHHITN